MGTTKYRSTNAKSLDIPPISTLRISRLPRREPSLYGLKANQQVYDDAEQLGLVINNENYFDHITMSGYLWPYTSFERLVTLVYFNAIGFYIDDTIGSEIELLPESDAAALRMSIAWKTQQILVDNTLPAAPDKYDLALLKLRQGVVELSNPDFGTRFFALLLEHWKDSTTSHELDGVYKGGIDEYIVLRRSCSGMVPTILLIEYAKDHYLPEGTLDLVPGLGDAINAVADIGGLSNDLFSYAKEVISGGTSLNLIPIVQRERGYVLSKFAILDAMAIVNQKFEAFEQAVADAYQETDRIEDPGFQKRVHAFLDDFVDGMWTMIAGAYHWQTETNRYRHEQNPFPDLRTPIAE